MGCVRKIKVQQEEPALNILLEDLEGRLAGVLNRFFRDKKESLKEALVRLEVLGVDPSLLMDEEMVELAVASNALLLQLASLVVLIQRKTGGELQEVIDIESSLLRSLLPQAKIARDDLDRLSNVVRLN